MSEGLFRRLLAVWADGPWVIASVLGTRGATPRKVGAMMLIAETECFGTVGGGEAEARVQRRAMAMLAEAVHWADLSIDLGGGPGAAGICGGQMHLALRRLSSAADRGWVQAAFDQLRAGRSVQLTAVELGASESNALQLDALERSGCGQSAAEKTDRGSVSLQPNPRLLIIGGGHCGVALYQLARLLDFDIWLFDERPDQLAPLKLSDAHCLHGDFKQLALALDTERPLYAVLLTRNFECDIAALRVLATRPPTWTGMMGSRRRVHEVVSSLPELITQFQRMLQQSATRPAECAASSDTPYRLAGRPLMAPVGLDIGAETPQEIAVSILAQVVAVSRAAG